MKREVYNEKIHANTHDTVKDAENKTNIHFVLQWGPFW